MRKMRLLMALTAALMAAPAFAAPKNTTTPPPFVWTGFYAGANAGGGFGSNCWFFGQLAAPFQDQGCHDFSGGLGGGQLGFNWQSGKTVFGIEGSGNWGKLTGSHTPANNSQGTLHTSLSQALLVTGRIGYAFDQFLIYGKGGVGFIRQRLERTCNGVTPSGACVPVGALASYGDQNRQSFAVGGGAEYAITRNLSVALDYTYLPMGNRDAGYTATAGYSCGGSAGGPCSMAGDEKLSVVTVRLNWLFGRP